MDARPAGNLYEADFYAWGRRQARAIAAREHRAFDIENLIDEVESVGRSQRAAIESHLRVLVIHLLKFRYQPERATASWRVTLRAQRREIERLVARSPSLRGYPAEILGEAYRDAVRGAARETGLPEDRFPASIPFTLDQILDPGFEP
ncbi:DUF29 domain-containing protein [Methylobacterium sp. NEAU 140]|uniref:DUF29 domain-containing protein n=1 Tax=Methylobacterium sp. NEAU 140 TaxID=3064945 RepID=UPI002737560D|nr:DUF29 domain-containing protein [Methylobacterium sp. NEAU 140]MDP4024808.1 DUF29 domain-containing protein [Methylobacterium sp. NEAU 140]